MKVLVIDNYDSFTYNLVYIIRHSGYDVTVRRNDKITLGEVGAYDKILLSPGPGVPDEAGIVKQVVIQYGMEKSILGVCLGHQGIAEVYGATLHNLSHVLHGVDSEMKIVVEGDYLFENIPGIFKACHYHSWVVVPESVNGQLEVLATDKDANIMAIRHKLYDVRGVQFHPESILTQNGKQIIDNWLSHKK